MKFKECHGYVKNTEIEKQEIGSAAGKILYRDVEIIVSETCTILDKIDNFECDNCPAYLAYKKGEKQ